MDKNSSATNSPGASAHLLSGSNWNDPVARRRFLKATGAASLAYLYSNELNYATEPPNVPGIHNSGGNGRILVWFTTDTSPMSSLESSDLDECWKDFNAKLAAGPDHDNGTDGDHYEGIVSTDGEVSEWNDPPTRFISKHQGTPAVYVTSRPVGGVTKFKVQSHPGRHLVVYLYAHTHTGPYKYSPGKSNTPDAIDGLLDMPPTF